MSSIYKNGRFYWHQIYRDGKVIRRQSLNTEDRTEAKILSAKLDQEYESQPGDPITCQKALRLYIDTLKQRCSHDYQKSTERRLKAILGDLLMLKDLTSERIQSDLSKRIGKYDHNNSVSAIKAFTRWCVQSDYIVKNPADIIKKIVIQERTRQSFTVDEIERIIQKSKKETIYPLIMTALYTGMRRAELLRLQWKDIDMKAGVITVTVSKSKKVRRIPISSELKAVLSSCRKSEGFICDIHNHRRILKRILKRSKVTGGWHHFRHTFCTMALRSGADLQTVCALAGHSSPVVTSQYLSSTPSHMADAVNRLHFTKNKKSL